MLAPPSSAQGTSPPSEEDVSGEAPFPYPRLEHSGQIQFQVNDGSLGAAALGGNPANNGLAPFQAQDNTFVRRFRPSWTAEFSPTVSIDTEFNVQPDGMRIDILDARLNIKLSEHEALALGRYKVPFGWEGLRSSRATNTIERSDATVYLYPERDIGISVHHSSEGGEYSVGTFLGQPRSNGDTNAKLDLIGRGVKNLGETTKVGFSGHLGSFRPTGTDQDLPVRRLGTELHFEDGPFKFEGEALWSDGYNTASRANTEAFGYYATAIYRVADPLDLVLNYDRFDPDLGASDPNVPNNRTNDRDRKLIGLNYYISRDPVHRIMLNYEFRQSLEGAEFHDSGFRLRYQISW